VDNLEAGYVFGHWDNEALLPENEFTLGLFAQQDRGELTRKALFQALQEAFPNQMDQLIEIWSERLWKIEAEVLSVFRLAAEQDLGVLRIHQSAYFYFDAVKGKARSRTTHPQETFNYR
jgi:hypothetical protein